jgi:TrmH family RNA methyltransferase
VTGLGLNNYYAQRRRLIYNPKVVQATMGSIARVNELCGYKPLFQIPNYRFFGTMDGQYLKAILPREGIIIMGNEANGIWKIWKS